MIGTPSRWPVARALTPDEAAEVRRLWADYYEASARALEIMRAEGTTEAVLPRIATEAAKAAAAMRRLKELHGIKC
jgi:DNA invertase Pin-like site-specific DNA recombinase